MKNLFSKIKIDTLEKKLDDSLSKIIKNSGEKIVKEIDDFTTKSPEDQWKIIQDKIEEGKNLLTSTKESTENNEDDRDTYNKTTPAIGAYLVCDGAMCSCDQGAMPMLKIPIESHKKYYANDKLAATIKDSNLPKPFFVKCNLKSPPGDVSCTYAKSDWVIKKGDGHPTVGGNDVLIDNGEITCPIGGKITIVNHGQQTSVSSKDIEGFSVDAAPAINSLMPVDTILKEGQEQEEMTTPSIKYIEYNGQSSDKEIAIIERASQRLDFKAAINATAKTATKNNPKKLKGDPRLVSWAILKKDESLENWKIFPSYGDVIPLIFTEEGTYIILAYGKRPTTINNSDLIKFDKKNWDKNCYFELEVVKGNPITHLEINNLKATESQTITKGNTCTIIPKTRLPLTDEERNSLILEIRNGSNNALVYEQKGDAKYMLPTDQETDYQIYTYYEGSVRPNPVKITIIENEIDNISPKMYPTDRFVRHGEEVSFTADLKNKDNIKDEKIHWVVNGEEKSTGKVFLFKFPANKTKDTDYKIEVYYKNLLSSKKLCIRTITAKQNKVNKIIVSNVTSDNCVFVDQSYDIKADTVIPYTKVFDSPIKWKFIFISSKGESSNKNYPAATIYSQSSSVKQMTTYSIEFEAEDKIKFIPHKVGSYTIAAVFNGITTVYILTVKNAQVKTWRFASSNGWTMNKLGMNQAFNIELEIEGGGNQELSLSLYIECEGIGTNSKEVPLGKFKTDQSGKIPVVTIDKDHKFWNEAYALIKGSFLDLGTKQVSLVVSGKVNIFEGKHAVKEGLSLYLPLPKGDMIAPTVQLNRSLEYDARFVDADNNKLLKIVQYGEPVKAQIRILKGYNDSDDVLTKNTFLFTLRENQKGLGNDKTIDEYKKVPKKLNDGEDILEYDIATDKLGKDTHIKDKGNEYNPRLFYFYLEKKGTVADPDILTYPKRLDDLFNDETIIDLEVHDEKNDDAIDNRNEKKINETGKYDKYDYFNQLKVASSTLLNKSLEKKAMAIIGEELIKKKTREHTQSGKCPRCDEYIRATHAEKSNENEIVLKDLFPKAEDSLLRGIAQAYNDYMVVAGMNNCWCKAHFFTQAAVECGEDLSGYKGENTDFSEETIYSLWPAKFFHGAYVKGKGFVPDESKSGPFVNRNKKKYVFLSEEQSKKVSRLRESTIKEERSKAIANYIYATTNRNTGEASGDGWRFRGSGLVQLTGRGNFEEVYNIIKKWKTDVVDILSNDGAEEVRTDPYLTALTSMGYFYFTKLNEATKGCGNAMPVARVVGNDVKNPDGTTNHGLKNNFFQNNSKKVFLIDQCDWGSIDSYNIPEEYKDKIEIVLNRTRNMKDRTVGTISVDGGVIECYSLERDGRPPEKELEEKSKKRIRASTCRFEINQASKEKPQHVFASLRLDDKDVPGTRIGILMHAGPTIKGGWTEGCILPNPNEPIDDDKNKYVDSLIQVNKIVEYVRQREKEISKRLGIPIASIERKIIIKQDNEKMEDEKNVKKK